MDNKTLFIRTNKGEDEVRSSAAHLAGDIRRALVMVDGTATFGEISKRAAPSLRGVLDEMLKELEKGGFIQDKAKASNIPRMIVPPKMSVPARKPVEDVDEELDFTAAFRPPSREAMAAEAAKAEADAKAKQEADAAKLKKAQQEAEAAKAKAEAEAKAREEAERRAREEAEAARLKAQQEALASRPRLEVVTPRRPEVPARTEHAKPTPVTPPSLADRVRAGWASFKERLFPAAKPPEKITGTTAYEKTWTPARKEQRETDRAEEMVAVQERAVQTLQAKADKEQARLKSVTEILTRRRREPMPANARAKYVAEVQALQTDIRNTQRLLRIAEASRDRQKRIREAA